MATHRPPAFAIAPPIEPMLAKLAEDLPTTPDWLYEPKWDGFRAIVFRGREDVFIQSRDLRPLDRYFPELHAAFLRTLPAGCVIDGEIVVVTKDGLDFVDRIEGKKVVLIDGGRLAELMIEHGLGVTTTKTYTLREVSNDFFDESEG